MAFQDSTSSAIEFIIHSYYAPQSPPLGALQISFCNFTLILDPVIVFHPIVIAIETFVVLGLYDVHFPFENARRRILHPHLFVLLQLRWRLSTFISDLTHHK